MTKHDTVKLFALIKALYPRDTAFQNATPEMVNAWSVLLADVPFSVAQAGLQAHVSTSPFPPSIAEIKCWAAKFNHQIMDASEAWGIARKAISKWGVHAKAKARETTPPDVWAVIDRMGWEDMCMSDNPDVIRGQFCRLWDAYAKRAQEVERLPENVRKMLAAAPVGLLNEAPVQ